MKVTIEHLGGAKRQRFSEFADRHGLELVVRERAGLCLNGMGRYFCHFKNIETLSRGILSSFSGSGDTVSAAIADYAEELRGKRLVWCATSPERRDFDAPNEWATESFEEYDR